VIHAIILFLQTVPALNAEQEIAAHPYLVGIILVACVGAIFTLAGALAKLFLVQFERRMNEKFAIVERENDEQNKRLDTIENDLHRYDAHVAVGATETRAIHESVARVEAAVADHVHKEETTTWKKIDDLALAIGDLRQSHAEGMAKLAAGQDVLAVRVTSVEKKMPNGELQKLAEAFSILAESTREVTKRRR
jgi:hypothetical protein